jgi:hypothetical protein
VHETPAREVAAGESVVDLETVVAEAAVHEEPAREAAMLEVPLSETPVLLAAAAQAPEREVPVRVTPAREAVGPPAAPAREAPGVEVADSEGPAREAAEQPAREAAEQEARVSEVAHETPGRDAAVAESAADQAAVSKGPVVETPVRQAPDAQAPDAQAPDAQAPDAQGPDTEGPDTEAPVHEVPARETAGHEAKVSEIPVGETPIRPTPAAAAPVRHAPVREAPVSGPDAAASNPPVRETPVRETPVRETPVRETPVREAPVPETHVAETSVPETPVRPPAPGVPIPGSPTGAAPGSSQPRPGQPSTGQPSPVRPETAKPDPAKPHAANPSPAKPDPAKPTPSKPDVAPPESAKTDRPRPATIKPSRVEPGRPKTSPPEPPPAPPATPADREGAPPWSQVIATTVQLWLGRRVRSGRDALASPVSRRWAAALGLAIVVFAAGALTIALAQNRGGQGGHPASGSSSGRAHTTGSPNPVQLSPAALQAAARNRQQAAAWITAQVSHAAIVSCDPVMCQALTGAGYPAGDLLTLGPSATDPMGAQIVVDTTVLRNQLGSKLPSVYAPVVISGFGTGASRVDVRVEAPDGAAAYAVSQRADLLARQQAGQQLLGDHGLHLAAAARRAIAAGDVDSRLLVTLVALMGQRYPIYVYRFGDVSPGATPGVPMRMMRIAALVQRGQHASSYLHAVLHFLASQQPPYRASVRVLHLPGAKTSIQIEFAAPSPLGLLAHAQK